MVSLSRHTINQLIPPQWSTCCVMYAPSTYTITVEYMLCDVCTSMDLESSPLVLEIRKSEANLYDFAKSKKGQNLSLFWVYQLTQKRWHDTTLMINHHVP